LDILSGHFSYRDCGGGNTDWDFDLGIAVASGGPDLKPLRNASSAEKVHAPYPGVEYCYATR
jgi:hypothetical protein